MRVAPRSRKWDSAGPLMNWPCLPWPIRPALWRSVSRGRRQPACNASTPLPPFSDGHSGLWNWGTAPVRRTSSLLVPSRGSSCQAAGRKQGTRDIRLARRRLGAPCHDNRTAARERAGRAAVGLAVVLSYRNRGRYPRPKKEGGKAAVPWIGFDTGSDRTGQPSPNSRPAHLDSPVTAARRLQHMQTNRRSGREEATEDDNGHDGPSGSPSWRWGGGAHGTH